MSLYILISFDDINKEWPIKLNSFLSDEKNILVFEHARLGNYKHVNTCLYIYCSGRSEGQSCDDTWTKSPPDQGASHKGACWHQCTPPYRNAPLCILCRTRGLQWPPDEAPIFTEAVGASFLYISVTPRHPRGTIHFSTLFIHSTSFHTLT